MEQKSDSVYSTSRVGDGLQTALPSATALSAVWPFQAFPRHPGLSTEVAYVGWGAMPPEARASLRHFMSAAIIFGAGFDDKRDAYARALEAFDEWFALVDSAISKAPPVGADNEVVSQMENNEASK